MQSLSTLLILLLVLSTAQGQTGIDIQEMKIPSIAWKALGFLGNWYSTKNEKENDSGISFTADSSWKLITEAYAYEDSTNKVFIYSKPEGEKNRVWQEFVSDVSSFSPTAASTIYGYTPKNSRLVYIDNDGDVVSAGLCSDLYSLSVTGIALYGVFDDCLLATTYLYKLQIDNFTPSVIANIPGVAHDDIVDISADALGGAYAVDVNGNAYHYDADADQWTQILVDAGLFIVQVSANTLENSVWLLVDTKDGSGSAADHDFQVYMYST
mmetsp:Transcript_7007/g.5245  ORF Transcript_7007/g.5245 Transcript_7007/m.5245 type:complete len:268 (+) Transcript_7007:44-847(+)